VLHGIRRCDPTWGFCCEKKDFPIAQERERFGRREERGDGFSKAGRSLSEEMLPVSDGAINIAR
jgi:hypothetical protein